MEKIVLSKEIIRNRLYELADTQYQQFHAKLLPGVENVLGVRTPQLRKISKEICRQDWRRFLEENDREWYENDILQGLVTVEAKMPFSERMERVKSFIPRINNWAVCDIVCGSWKDVKTHKEETWDFLQPYLNSKEEYEIRFGVVMLLSYYKESAYLGRIFEIFNRITSDAYYVRMAVAWAVSVFYVYYPEETIGYLKENNLDDWTYRKALQKIIESYRVDEQSKQMIRAMKRK